MRRTLALALALAAAPLVAHADGQVHTYDDNKKGTSIACAKGDSVVISGNDDTIGITGPCASVTVSGNGNYVSIDAVAAISTPGNKNTVKWKAGLDGKDPTVSDVGTGNRIKRK